MLELAERQDRVGRVLWQRAGTVKLTAATAEGADVAPPERARQIRWLLRVRSAGGWRSRR